MMQRSILSTCCMAAVLMVTTAPARAQAERSRLAANTEPGALYMEDILPKPVRMTVAQEAIIYYQNDMQRVLGNMAAGTTVQLVAMSDTSYKVRGRARHGDVAGWMRMEDIKTPDPKLQEKLKALYVRQKEVDELIAKRQVALGMTVAEVKLSLGNPTRKSAKITAAGREEALEYSIFDKVPQTVTGTDSFGNTVQNIIYVRVEVGRLSLAFKDGTVSEIQESMGNPLGTAGVKMVPIPVTVF